MTKITRDFTDAQILRREAAKDAERIAASLESLAEQIRLTANQFYTENRPSAHIVADIVNDYVQGIGQPGCAVWGLIHELSRKDESHA